MRTPLRAAFRLALIGCLGLAAVSASATTSRAADPEKTLPDSTLFFFKVKNVAELRDSFKQSSFGQLLADPAMKPLKDDAAVKIEESGKELKAKLGVTISELLSLPQGTATIAVVSRSDPKLPVALLISADAGQNQAKMTEVMTKSTEQAKQADAKVGTESYKGLTLHIVQPPKNGDKPTPPLIWTNAGSVFHIATDLDALKDVISHADGRSDSLASVDAFIKSKVKLGDSSVTWFLDINKAIKLLVKIGQSQAGGGQNLEPMLQITGINGLKAAAGTFGFNSGAYDSVSKVFFLAPAPTQGILKLFMMPPTNLRPEPWVPANVASYYSLSWDLDGAYNALNDLVNQFQPGMLQVLQQQLVGPNGGEPLDLQKDIFGPLGNRLTLISDYKKPIKEDSQRFLLGISVTDAKKFQSSLNKIIEIAGGAPAKRDFLGTTIYDFKLPEMANAAAGGDNPLKNGTASMALAKDTLFVASEPAVLESVLRGGGTSLADNPDFQAVAKQAPSKVSSLSYTKSDEAARASYDGIKSGEYEKQFKAAPNPVDLSKFFDKAKLPDFSVFAKYLTASGGFGLMEDDGVTFTGFTLRKGNP